MKRWISLTLTAAGIIILPQFFFSSPAQAVTVSIGGLCLLLWITETVPAFVPTLLLWTLVPLLLGGYDPKFGLQSVLTWAADPVMALFFGGFVLGAATERSGLTSRLMRVALSRSGGCYSRFLLFVVLVTAFLSMWMSNIAAAALVLACLHPVVGRMDESDVLRRSLLIGVALAADLGGIATPIGTGPNAIAIASISGVQPISFVGWMSFAFPQMAGSVLCVYLLLRWKTRSSEAGWEDCETAVGSYSGPVDAGLRYRFFLILGGTIIFWLTEPVHGIPAAVVSLASAFCVFVSGLLGKNDLSKIDWSTLLLIAGGITLGRLLEVSGVVRDASEQIPFPGFGETLTLFLICVSSALLSALMSNTATAVLLIPIAMALVPAPSTAVLVAISASFGVPFVISTPPNAMVFGEGGVRSSDLFWPGVILMIGGCLLVSVSGPYVLRLAGIN
jgi:solute carrier family 13 (sodium-dependent dicarboxylate transporter), member 2/3/5